MHKPMLRRILLPTAALALAALLAWGMPGIAAAHAFARAATNGTITGTLVNGSKGNAPVAGQTVTLQQYVTHAQTQNAATTTTDASGHFSFSGLDGSGSTVYQLDVRYENGDFTSALIGFASGPTERQTLTIYDTTSDPSALSVTNTTMLISAPSASTGLIPVGVFITFKNTGKLAFAASTAAATGGMPTSLLRFALPPDAQNLTLGAGFTNMQAVQVDKGFAALATIPPGTTQFAYVYDLPYTGTDYRFQFQAVYPTAAVTMLVPPNILVDDGDFAAKPPVQALGQNYQLLEADSVQPGEVLKMRLWDLPYPGERFDLDQRQLVLFGGVLALLLALLIGLYLKRGNLAVALGIVPAAALAKPKAARGGQEHEAERKRLLKLLLTLENQHTSGQLKDAEYQRRRDNTRRKLKALLAANIGSVKSAQADFVAARHPGAVSTASPLGAATDSDSSPTEPLDPADTTSEPESTDSLIELPDSSAPLAETQTAPDMNDAAGVGALPAVPTKSAVSSSPLHAGRGAGGEDPVPTKSTRRRRALVGGRQ